MVNPGLIVASTNIKRWSYKITYAWKWEKIICKHSFILLSHHIKRSVTGDAVEMLDKLLPKSCCCCILWHPAVSHRRLQSGNLLRNHSKLSFELLTIRSKLQTIKFSTNVTVQLIKSRLPFILQEIHRKMRKLISPRIHLISPQHLNSTNHMSQWLWCNSKKVKKMWLNQEIV